MFITQNVCVFGKLYVYIEDTVSLIFAHHVYPWFSLLIDSVLPSGPYR